jgi:Asp-tRNA(Asn)/Glu-tRNA(Gln) amidotransferase A subunit family amidase
MQAADAVERALHVVAERETAIHAWVGLDPERARAEAAEVDHHRDGPLRGVVLGVKDVFDTGDQPTEYGSAIYAGHRPAVDAIAVAQLRQAGAVCLGKTVTAEFACTYPGPTRNPHRLDHTPGGSSMGSAAAVASGMADIAIGTQTAGSVIRPASFCGVYGFKPSFGAVSRTGLKLVAPSLDTVGWFARDPRLLDAVRIALTGGPPAPPLSGPPRLAVFPSEHWAECSEDSRQAVTATAARLTDAGAHLVGAGDGAGHRELAPGLGDQVPVVMAYEAARSLAAEHSQHREELSAELLAFLDWGATLDRGAYEAVLRRRVSAQHLVDAAFGDADALLTPAVLGEAPAGLDSTGDPRLARLWTLLGLPTVVVPAATGSTGLPVGVQVVGRPGGDAALLAITRWAGGALGLSDAFAVG